MSDGTREELRELLFDSAPPADVDREALFARTFASPEGAGAELLPPDGLFDLPADDPADEVLGDGDALLPDPDGDGDGGQDGAGVEPDAAADDAWGDPGDDPALDDPALDDPALGDPALGDPAGDAPDVPFGPGAGW